MVKERICTIPEQAGATNAPCDMHQHLQDCHSGETKQRTRTVRYGSVRIFPILNITTDSFKFVFPDCTKLTSLVMRHY